GETAAARQARLTDDSAKCAAEVADAQDQLATAQAQSASLSNDIAVLSAQIKAAQLKIQQENLVIQTLGQNISQKIENINSLQGQIDQGHRSLGEILVSIYESGDQSAPRILLSSGTLSQAMKGFDDFLSVQTALAAAFDKFRADVASNKSQKDQLTTQQNREEDARAVIQEQQNTIKAAQAQKQQL